MDATTSVDSEEMRAPTFFQSTPSDLSQRHRGSSQSDGRDVQLATPPTTHLHPRSSPAAASVDSFSSYINKDATLFQNRSSSPRVEDQLQLRDQNSDPASHAGSPHLHHPRHIVTTPVVSRDAFRNQHWAEHDAAIGRVSNGGVMSIEHLHNTTTQQGRRGEEREQDDLVQADEAEAQDDYHHQRVPASPSPAIDVKQLSMSNLAQKNQEDDAAGSTYRDAHMKAPASIMADDSFESTASVLGEDAKNEIRRRRRTRPDEANLLAQVYAKNPFPDHETRLFLANRVGMSVRAVSVWFQNRRQAEKKRSGRYGGSGIPPTNGEGTATPAPEASPAKPASVIAALPQRKPLGNASANAAGPVKRFDAQELKDLSSNNKENIPPWMAGRDAEISVQRHMEKMKRDAPLSALSKKETPLTVAHDLRQAVGPQGTGITAHRVEIDTAPTQNAVAAVTAEVASSSKSALSRHRSVPRLSLDDVLGGRSNTLRRAATEHTPAFAAVAPSEVEEEQLDTILPPPKLLSRASSASSLSLLTTSGGRASIGNLDLRKDAASPAPLSVKDIEASLTSSLPPKLTAALQRQGIIAMQPGADEQLKVASTVKGRGLLQMMPSSSASSSEADTFYGHGQQQSRDGEEDEERTLKMIAQRRAAKAQAAALAKAQAAREAAKNAAAATAIVPMDPGCADARQAIAQQACGGFSSSSVIDASMGSRKSGSTVVGLAPISRQLSLDWAAGRDRASTSALPTSIGGTPLSRSVSARQLSLHRSQPNESTPLSQQQQQRIKSSLAPDSAPVAGDKRTKNAAATGRRSLSATDLTRRLQEAKKKGDAAVARNPKKRTAAAAALNQGRDENVDPAAGVNVKNASAASRNQLASKNGGAAVPAPAKRRRAQLEDVVLAASAASSEALLPPAVSAKLHAMPSFASPMLTSRPFVPHASFPSATSSGRSGMPTMIVPSTPQSATSLYSATAAPLSTRSDRYRAIGASPATSANTTGGALGRSISASYPSHHHHHQRHSLPGRGAAPLGPPSSATRGDRSWEMPHPHHRSYTGEESWTPRSARSLVGGGESMSQPLPLTGSTPSRVLGDRTNFMSGNSMGSSNDSPFIQNHDDSGFFANLSDDEEDEEVLRGTAKGSIAKGGKGAISPRKASLRSMVGGRAETGGEDHQAAELLLGLGKTVGSRDSSSSQ